MTQATHTTQAIPQSSGAWRSLIGAERRRVVQLLAAKVLLRESLSDFEQGIVATILAEAAVLL